jgi:hypothetical protein
MRNPWKEGEWTGRFSDNGDDWTPELRKQLNHYPSNDGIFWMSFEDMIKTFDQVDICKIDDDAVFSYTIIDESQAGFAFVKFVVPEHCDRLTTFAVSQRGCRTEEAEGNYEFDLNSYTRRVDVGFIKLNDETRDWTEGNTWGMGNYTQVKHGIKEKSPYALRDTYIEFPYFEPGTYFMYVKVNWNGKASCKSFSVNCYGPVLIDF